MTPPLLTVFFIVEPPAYEVMACYLAASLREQFGAEIALVGYCPAEKIDSVSPDVRLLLERMDCALRPFTTQGRFDPPYPHGNKMLACLEPRDGDYGCFMDSDIFCLRPNRVENLIRPGHVSASMAASMVWAPQSIWEDVYAACGMEIPSERFRLMKQKRGPARIPYFSSGLVVFPERHRSAAGLSFPETWMQVAAEIEACDKIPKKRPYLDQLSLPLAIRRAGLDWNILPDAQHFILGGNARGEPLPQDREIFTVHYRNWQILQEVGLSRPAKKLLEKHAGVRRVTQAGAQAAAMAAGQAGA